MNGSSFGMFTTRTARDTPSHTLMIRRRSATDVAIFTGSALLPLAVRAMELALKLVVAEN